MDSVLRDRLTAAVKMLVYSMRALQKRYGSEALQVARDGYLLQKAEEMRARWNEEPEPRDRSLKAFCSRLEEACIGTHEWTRVIDDAQAIGYRFTRCLWAEIFRSLNAAEIGRWICDSDEIVLKSFNEDLRLRIAKRLMDGDPYCDHVYCTRSWLQKL